MNDIWLGNVSLNIYGDNNFFILSLSIFLTAYSDMIKVNSTSSGNRAQFMVFMAQCYMAASIILLVDPTQFYQPVSLILVKVRRKNISQHDVG